MRGQSARCTDKLRKRRALYVSQAARLQRELLWCLGRIENSKQIYLPVAVAHTHLALEAG